LKPRAKGIHNLGFLKLLDQAHLIAPGHPDEIRAVDLINGALAVGQVEDVDRLHPLPAPEFQDLGEIRIGVVARRVWHQQHARVRSTRELDRVLSDLRQTPAPAIENQMARRRLCGAPEHKEGEGEWGTHRG
jgi:hypothetical protein